MYVFFTPFDCYSSLPFYIAPNLLSTPLITLHVYFSLVLVKLVARSLFLLHVSFFPRYSQFMGHSDTLDTFTVTGSSSGRPLTVPARRRSTDSLAHLEHLG